MGARPRRLTTSPLTVRGLMLLRGARKPRRGDAEVGLTEAARAQTVETAALTEAGAVQGGAAGARSAADTH